MEEQIYESIGFTITPSFFLSLLKINC